MASGYFPVSKIDTEGKKLLEAIRIIKDVAENLGEASAAGCVPEDAIRDGEYIADLYRAVSLVRPAIEGHITHRSLCVKVQRLLTDYLPPDSPHSAHDTISNILAVIDGPEWHRAEGTE